MAKLPKADMILAGFLAHISLTSIILKATEDEYFWWMGSDLCRLDGIPWLLLIMISAGVALITMVKSKKGKAVQGVIAFAASFLLNCCGGFLGLIAVFCSRFNNATFYDFEFSEWRYMMYDIFFEVREIYSYCSIAIMALASIGIVAHYILKATPQATKIPDPEVVLLGVCVHFTIWHIINSSDGYYDLCEKGGIGSWLLLLALSAILAILTWIKTTESSKAPRSLITFIGTFLHQLILGSTGSLALDCAGNTFDYVSDTDAYGYAVLLLNAVIALAIMIRFLTTNPAPPNPQGVVVQNPAVHAPPNQSPGSYPMQPIYPASATYPPQPSYPPQISYPPQASCPPQASYSQQVSYTPQGSYPPPNYQYDMQVEVKTSQS